MSSLVLLPARATRLRLLVLAISDRCDQRCLHCQIWMGPASGRQSGLSREERLRVVEEAIGSGVEQVLLTGGEPLLSPDLWPIAERLQQADVAVLLATNGLLLERFAGQVGRLVDELYVSLDGAAPATHDGLRGVPSLGRVREGIAALRALPRRPRLVARSTLHARNLNELEAIIDTAREVGFDHVSFLPLDTSSDAFGGRREERARLRPSAAQVHGFEGAVARLVARRAFEDGFVLESAAKLARVAHYLRADAGLGAHERPECDAPWWSSVVEADGALRPCFFHAPAADVREGLIAARRSKRYASALGRIRASNPTCERCVCPKRRGLPLLERLLG